MNVAGPAKDMQVGVGAVGLKERGIANAGDRLVLLIRGDTRAHAVPNLIRLHGSVQLQDDIAVFAR